VYFEVRGLGRLKASQSRLSDIECRPRVSRRGRAAGDHAEVDPAPEEGALRLNGPPRCACRCRRRRRVV